MRKLTGVLMIWMLAFSVKAGPGMENGKVFSEGKLQYTVLIGPAVSNAKANDPTTTGKGTLTFYLKYGKCRMEMKMNNGFMYTLLYDLNGDGAISLVKNGDDNYALKLTDAEYKRQNFNDAEHKTTLTDESKELSGMPAKKAEITVSPTRHIDVFYATNLTVSSPRFFNMFPGVNPLPGVPLHYDSHEMADNTQLVLSLDTMEVRPIDSRMFDVPRGYALITMDKYKSILKK